MEDVILKEMPAWTPTEEDHGPDGPAAPALWSGKAPPPAVGSEITASINALGRATVVGYRIVEGYLGVVCDLHAAPAWHVRQNAGNPRGLLFGTEIAAA